jgi:hypothetical protein
VPKHELSLEASDFYNQKVLRVFDTSNYCDDEAIENYLVEVLPVNKSAWVAFYVQRGFSLALNSSNLRYRKVDDESGLIELPDGIYEIKQSYKPNIHTVVHFYHLRVSDLKSKLKKEWDNLVDDVCKLSRQEFNSNRDKLREIDEFVMAAKYKVEECHAKKEGKEMYEWAKKLLEQYSNECQC